MNQLHDNIPVFGRSVKIHFNIYDMPSSMTSNIYQGKFENSNPSLILDHIKNIISNDFLEDDFVYKNIQLIYYIQEDIGKLVYHIDAVNFNQAYRYLIGAHNGEIIKKWSLIHDEGPAIGSGENLLEQWVDTLHIYEGDSFSAMGDLISPNLVCEEYCWDYGDCDGQNYNSCELSYSQGSCDENYIEDCNGDCFHE